MLPWTRLRFGIVLGTLFLASSCGHPQIVLYLDPSTLSSLVRAYGQGGQPAESTSVKQIAEKSTSPTSDADGDESEYKNQIALYLVDKNYDALEHAIHDARANKTRFKGGAWKVAMFYDGLSAPTLGDKATDEDWEFHINGLKAWETARPESAAARIALAETYLDYAEKARGGGYADTVSDNGWKLFGERTAMAASALADAAKLKEKCPYWYESMQQLALAQGWDKTQARQLLDQATAFEPGYYHYYREYAQYLLPKWYGEPGEAEAFAEEASNQVGGKEGKFIYFEVASLIACQCDSDDSHMEHLSWPKIKEGYAALGELYGYSNLKMNRFAHMAVEANDKAAARQVFAAIGDDWDHSVWHSSSNFDNAKAWAGAP